MKKMLSTVLALVLMFLLSSVAANAIDQCDVVGNSYTIDYNGTEWALQDFTDVVGFSPAPRCGGMVYLVYPSGEFDTLDWCVTDGGLFIGGTPANLTDDGLEVYLIPGELHTLHVGGTVYKTEQEIPTLLFK